MVTLHSKYKQVKLSVTSLSKICMGSIAFMMLRIKYSLGTGEKNAPRYEIKSHPKEPKWLIAMVPRFSRSRHHGTQAQREQERGAARHPLLQVCWLPLPQLDLAQAGQWSLHGTSVCLEGGHAIYPGLRLSLLNRCSLFHVRREV